MDGWIKLEKKVEIIFINSIFNVQIYLSQQKKKLWGRCHFVFVIVVAFGCDYKRKIEFRPNFFLKSNVESIQNFKFNDVFET